MAPAWQRLIFLQYLHLSMHNSSMPRLRTFSAHNHYIDATGAGLFFSCRQLFNITNNRPTRVYHCRSIRCAT